MRFPVSWSPIFIIKAYKLSSSPHQIKHIFFLIFITEDVVDIFKDAFTINLETLSETQHKIYNID